MERIIRRTKMDSHENIGNDNSGKDKKIDDAIKIVGQVVKGLYEKDRSVLENPDITSFVEKNFGVVGKEYYDKMKESYLR